MDKPSWDYVLPFWWAFFCRATLIGFVAGAVTGGIGGFIAGMLGMPQSGALVGGILGFVVSVPVSLLVMRYVLAKPFKTFSVQFVRNAG